MPTPGSRTSATALTLLLVATSLSLVLPVHHDAATATTTADTRPNVILILTDDQTLDAVESAMPYVSKRADWITFDRAFFNVALCCPSRTTLLTGQYSHHHGVESNVSPGPANFDDSSTLATWLQDAGYRTGLIGKYLNSYPWDKGTGYIPPGWSDWRAFHKTPTYNDPTYYDYALNVNGTLVNHGSAPEDYSTDVLTSHALDFLEASPGQPFFLWWAPAAAHAPRTPAPRHDGAFSGVTMPRSPSFNEADVSDKPAWVQALSPADPVKMDSQRQRQYETMLSVDEGIQAIFDQLTAQGILDETMVIFMTDNGFSFGEHRWQNKKCPYEECIRTPLLVRYPGQGARTVQHLISNIDVAPTIADVAGISPELVPDGVSFRPILEGVDGGLSTFGRTGVLIHWAGDAYIPAYWGVRSGTHTYVEYDTGERELYDLTTDPHQLQNVAGDGTHATTQSELADLLSNLRASARDPHGPVALPARGALFGAHAEVDPAWPGSGDTRREAVETLESLAQRKMALERVFYRWDEVFPTSDDEWSRDQGRTLLLSWSAGRTDDTFTQWADIAAGLHDAEIDDRAQRLKAFGGPIVVVFHHEPQNGGPNGGAGTNEEFIAAYRHVHGRFGINDVTNVSFGYVEFGWSFRDGTVKDTYPGDDVVDVIGVDGYNWYGCNGYTNSPWRSFSEVFLPFYWFGYERNKPMIVFEWGSGEDADVVGRKGAWIAEGQDVTARWPRIKGISWFNSGRNPGCPRWIDTSPSSLAAFQAMGADPYYKPFPMPTFTSGPPSLTADGSATFEFTSDPTDVTFTCSLDGGSAAACTSPVTANNLGLGPHSLTIQPTSSEGLTGSSATWRWEVASVARTVSISDSAVSPRSATINVGRGVRWKNDGTVAHTVTDATGLGLFDSGQVPPGHAWTHAFSAAGTYAYQDVLSTIAGRVNVSPTVTPSSGTISTDFELTWAWDVAAQDRSYEVQVRRPGTAWQTWMATTSPSGRFTPDVGTGTYSFRSRLRDSMTGARSGWSPAVSISVG